MYISLPSENRFQHHLPFKNLVMKKFLFIALSVFLTASAYAQDDPKTTYVIDGSETLYIIDGVVSSKSAAENLPGDEVRSMNVVKGIKQAVLITTKSGRSISGYVVDEERKPIFGALVQVEGAPGVGTVTDEKGYYEINIPAGKTHVSVSFIDYDTTKLEAGKADKGTIILYPTGSTQDVRVVAYSGKPKEPTEAEASIKIRHSGDDDPLMVIKDADGKIYKTDDMKSIDPETIKTITVLKDNSTEKFKQYGDTSNGVIYIELK